VFALNLTHDSRRLHTVNCDRQSVEVSLPSKNDEIVSVFEPAITAETQEAERISKYR